MQPALILPLRPSWRLTGLLLVAHGGMVFVLLSLADAGSFVDAGFIMSSGLLAVFASLVWQLMRLHGSRRIDRLVLRPDGRVECRLAGSGEFFEAAIDTAVSRRLPGLLIIQFRDAGNARRVPLVLLPDALSVTDFRRLCVWLRWRAGSD
jgi:hypothetical protein